MSDSWHENGVRYESRGLYSTGDALDNAPLLGDEFYNQMPLDGEPEAEEKCRCHWQTADRNDGSYRLVAAIAVTLLFMILEALGGYMARSLAIMSDAAHLLSDCLGFGLALVAFRMSARPADEAKTYGYARAEVLGALLSILLIWCLTGVLVYEAAERIWTGVYDIRPDSMLVVSGLGILANVAIAAILAGCGAKGRHLHSHGDGAHSHSVPECGNHVTNIHEASRRDSVTGDTLQLSAPARRCSRADVSRNINLRAAFIHAVGDLLQSVGVFIAATVIKISPELQVVDPICTFLFSVIVAFTTVGVFSEALSLLLQAVPRGFRLRDAVAAILKVRGVLSVHSANAWGLTSDKTVFTAHVVIEKLASHDAVLRECVLIGRQFGAHTATLQVETEQAGMAACRHCRPA